MVNTFEEMLGQTINKIWINDENTALLFETTGGDFIYETEADCCNSVWFEHVSLSPKLIGSYLMGVEEKDWVVMNEGDYEVLEHAFWTLRTSNGYIDLEVRNSHNGYYGGRITFVEDQSRRNEDYVIKKEDMRELTEDL